MSQPFSGKHAEMEFTPCTSREYALCWDILDNAANDQPAREIRQALSDVIKTARLREPLR